MNLSDVTDKVQANVSEATETAQRFVLDSVRRVGNQLPDLPFADEVRDLVDRVYGGVEQQIAKQRAFTRDLFKAAQPTKKSA